MFAFVWEILIGGMVLIPLKVSHTYCLARATSDYTFEISGPEKRYHGRNIEIIKEAPQRRPGCKFYDIHLVRTG